MRTTTRKTRALRTKIITAAVSSCFASASALANPTGMDVVQGTVSASSPLPGQLVITNSPNSIINWQGFSIDAGELTRFMQQSSSSAVLNRVVTNDASSILGTLQSNGRVFLINPNGIVFGPGSTVDVAGLVASSLNLTDANFVAGNLHFQGDASAGAVTNQGNIFVQPGGQVYLIGTAVTNGGMITSPQGDVVLAAGNTVDLVSPSTPGLSVTVSATGNEARNLGQIFADSGRIGIFAGLIDQRGYVQANTAVVGQDGTIKFQATGTTTLAAGSQTNSTGALDIDSGDLVVNGRAFSGPQTIRADSILLESGASGTGNWARLQANSGSQDIWAGAGGLTMIGGAGGSGNNVMIQQASTDPLATQTIRSDGPLWVQGGEGDGNFALIRGYGGRQTVEAGNTTLLAGAGGVDNFVSIQAPVEDMTVHGDLTLTARGSGRDLYGGGVKIGGLGGAGSPTQLALLVDGDLTTTAGSTAGTGVVIGNTVSSVLLNNISITAGGNVTLNGGTAPDTYSRIGAPGSSNAGGDIAISAPSGTIALNSTTPDAHAVIRTADGVSLNAQQITEGPDARIEAGSLTVQTSWGASLTGANSVDAFNAPVWWGGNIAFNNTSPLLTVTSAINPVGGLSLQQTGDLLVNGSVSTGPQTIDVTGGLTVQNEPFSLAQIGASGGQSINAGYVEVNAVGGGGASIYNVGGEQHIVTTTSNAAGDGLVVRGSDGAFATINASSGGQYIDVRNADRAVVDASSGFANIINIDGAQTVSVTGSGANALVLGSPGALAQSVIGGGSYQTVVAGNPGEQGSITLYGTDSGSFGNTLIVSNPVPGGTQTVSTSGALSVIGGTAPSNVPTGIFANGVGGQQTVHADSILLQGGASGSNNSAMIGANNGSQTIDVGAGGITLIGGAGGFRNFAMINQALSDPIETQSVHTTGNVLLQGGDGNFNFAMIRGFGGQQTIEAGNTTLLGGATGTDDFASIQGRSQDMTVHGDLALTARGSMFGTAGGGVRIGGVGGGSPSATQLALQVDGNLTMTAGSVSGTGALLGSATTSTQPNDVSVVAGGDVTLNGGTASNTYSRIGAVPSSDAGGDVAISAPTGTIALNSTAPDASAVIRTADGVTLNAQQISEAPDARIEAGSLTVQTFSGASLTGANAVDVFSAANWLTGDLAFSNSSPLLTVSQAININGALSLQQTGDLLVNGDVSSGPQTIAVTGGLTVQNEPLGFAQLSASGGQSIDAGYVEVNGRGMGGSATIFNFGGEQRVVTTSKNAAGEGLAVRAVDGAYASINAPSGPQRIEVRNADAVVVEGLSGVAAISDVDNVQSLSATGPGANALVLGSSGALGQSIIGGGSTQSVIAGNLGEQGSITLYGPGEIASSSNFGTTQSVTTSGALSVIGRSVPGDVSAGIFAHGFGGQQTVRADSIVVQGGFIGSGNSSLIFANSDSQIIEAGAGGITLIGGTEGPFNAALITSNGMSQTIDAATSGITLIGGASGSNNSAQIAANGGSQTIEAGASGITLIGGTGGSRNFAMINQALSDPAATQSVQSTGDVLLQGGEGNFNFAMIRGFGGQQTIEAGNTTLLAGAAGTDNFASIQGRNQDMTVHGDLALTARGSMLGTAGGGVRIGGVGGNSPSATQLALQVDGNVTMTAGSVDGTGALLGSATTSTQPNDVAVVAGGDVTLNGGTGPNTYSLIGAVASSDAGGDIAISAPTGTIALNSTAPDAYAVIRTADGVSLNAQHVTEGPDARIEAGSLTVQTSWGASLTGANGVDMFNASNGPFGDVAFNNASPVLTVSNVFNPGGTLSLQQAGDLLVNGTVISGPQTIDTTGGVVVRGEAGGNAQLSASGGQVINAGYLEVAAEPDSNSTVSNFDGDQTIGITGANASGESLAVRGTGTGFASIVEGNGAQTIALTGPGPNALVMGNLSDPGGSIISGDVQTIVAGNPGQSGSITLYGPLSQMISGAVFGGSQSVRTSGSLALIGSPTASSPFPAGIFAQGINGLQTIQADSIVLQGGAATSGNSATITAINGAQAIEAGTGGIRLIGGAEGSNNMATIVASSGSQTIEAGSGGITLLGGVAGNRNFAIIHQLSSDPAANQSVHTTGNVLLQGGEGSFNFAMIRAFAGQQTFEAGNTTLLAGAGGTDNFASIQGRGQEMTVHGDLALTARGSVLGTAGGGVRIGGTGGASPSATQLALQVDGNLTMTGGSVAGTGALLGSLPSSALSNDISVVAGGDVTLNGGTGPNTNSLIGAVASSDAGGNIAITADGTIALNSTAPDAYAVIRTADGVSLNAQQVTEGPDARIEAGSLAVQTSSGASLMGANGVSSFYALNSASGDVALNNTSHSLTVAGIDQVPTGALWVNQTGDMIVAGDVRSGAQSLSASGDLTISPGSGSGLTVRADGPLALSAGGNFSLLGGSAWNGYAQATATGPMQINAGGDVRLRGGSGLLAYSLLYGRQDIRFRVGNELHLDHGTGALAFARVQTDFWRRIFIDFPDRTSGGYFVNGAEGVTHAGLDGFYTGLLPARLGRSLLVTYGE